MRDGVLAGLAVAIAALLLPNTGEPSVAVRSAGVLTWLAVIMAVGVLNALLLYGLACTIIRRSIERT